MGPEHNDISESLNNLGELYRDLGKYSEAETVYLRALEIRENNLNSDNPAIAESLNNLGLLYCNLGRYHEAEFLHIEKELAIEAWMMYAFRIYDMLLEEDLEFRGWLKADPGWFECN